jgi:uncharacterized OB-fold protein
MSGVLERPMPPLTPESDHFYREAAAGRVVVEVCESCATARHYPGGSCPHCGSPDRRWQTVSGLGSLYSFVVVHRIPLAFFSQRTPYAVGLVELDDAPKMRLLADLDVDPALITVGMRLQAAFEPVDDEHAVVVFEALEVDS